MRNRLQFFANQPASGPAFDSDAQDYFDRITTAGSTIDADQKEAINDFVVGLKTDNVWSYIHDLNPLCGSNLAGALVKLKYSGSNPSSYTDNGVGTTTYTANIGLTAVSTNHIDTRVDIPTLVQMGTLYGGFISATGTHDGSWREVFLPSYDATGDSDRFYLSPSPFNAIGYGVGGTYSDSVIGSVTTGLYMYGTDASNVRVFKDSTSHQNGGGTNAWQAAGTLQLFRGGSDVSVGIVLVTQNLPDDAAQALINSRIQTLMTDLGRA